MSTEIKITYPEQVEQYRQFLLGELRRMELQATMRIRELSAAIVITDDVSRIRRELLQRQQPLIDELARVYSIHAQFNLILAS